MKIPGRAFWFTKLALGLAVIAWLVSRTDLESLWSTLRSIESESSSAAVPMMFSR